MKMDIFKLKAGDKLKFKGTDEWFWYTDIKEEADKKLKKKQVYTIKEVQIASSWTGIRLVEVDSDIFFNVGWFKLV